MTAAFVGVISFGTTCFARSRGQIADIALRFGLPVYQIARGDTSSAAPFNTPSRVLGTALRNFHRDHGECLLVAYADRAFNEMGTIYQACNALRYAEDNSGGIALKPSTKANEAETLVPDVSLEYFLQDGTSFWATIITLLLCYTIAGACLALDFSKLRPFTIHGLINAIWLKLIFGITQAVSLFFLFRTIGKKVF